MRILRLYDLNTAIWKWSDTNRCLTCLDQGPVDLDHRNTYRVIIMYSKENIAKPIKPALWISENHTRENYEPDRKEVITIVITSLLLLRRLERILYFTKYSNAYYTFHAVFFTDNVHYTKKFLCSIYICYTWTYSIYKLHKKLRIFNILNFFV